MTREDDEMLEKINKQSLRRSRFENRPSFWRQTVYTGTLGILFILPVVAGAYLGNWLDDKYSGYNISWTINLILLGVIAGSINVYLFIRDRL